MAEERKSFLLRLPPELWKEIEKWAADELRSLNGQIEFVLRNALLEAGRLRPRSGTGGEPPSEPKRRGPGAPGPG